MAIKCVAACNRAILNGFYNYGYFLGKHPLPFIVITVIICGGLGIGMLYIDPESDSEVLYTPEGSPALKNRETMVETFPDRTADNYHSFSLNTLVAGVKIIVRSRGGRNILDKDILDDIEALVERVKAINLTSDGVVFTYEDLCARFNNTCVQGGAYIFTPLFRALQDAGNITYPLSPYFPQEFLSSELGRVDVSSTDILQSAGSIRLDFPLSTDWYSWQWEEEFLDFMQKNANNFTNMEVAFSASESLGLELDASTSGDIIFFALTFALMITYSGIVTAGGDCVSTRAFLAFAGVMASVFGIVSSFGLITLCGVRYVNMVGIMPFLLLGIGVDDMFLLMSSWSETTEHTDLSIPERMGQVFKKAGIGITITSVTNLLSFAIGATSVFYSIRNFCIYTGVGVVMCYLANATFFGACMTLHGRRGDASRHAVSCHKVEQSPMEMRQAGRSWLYSMLCGGTVPDHAFADQSACEKGPRAGLPRFIMWTPVRIAVFVVFAVYLAISIWGCTRLEEGLDLKDLVKKSSYMYKFQTWNDEDFGVYLPVSFVTTKTHDYRSNETYNQMVDLIAKAKSDPLMDPHIEVCWLTAYAQSPLYNTTSDQAFFQGLLQFVRFVPNLENDIVVDLNNLTITASRCHVYSKKTTDSNQQAKLMQRMRDVAADSEVVEFAYHASFVYFEQYLVILPSTMQTVGITLVVMMVVTAIFLPQPLIVVLVMVQVVMIVTGIFGFMALWGLTLSSITMVHLIMSVGFSVDFCAHVCTAYMVSGKPTRQERAQDAIVHASGPILNGGTSSMVGILGLIFSESFIFQAFFKIMLLVIGFGVAHAVFFVPVLLSFIGPNTYVEPEEDHDVRHAQSNGYNRSGNGATNGHNMSNGKVVPGEFIDIPDLSMNGVLQMKDDDELVNRSYSPSFTDPDGDIETNDKTITTPF